MGATNWLGSNNAPLLFAFKYSISRHLLSMMLDDTRCGLDASSLHRATSMDNYKVENFGLLSCHRDTSSNARRKAKEKLRICLPSFLFINKVQRISVVTFVKSSDCILLNHTSLTKWFYLYFRSLVIIITIL